MAEFRRNNYSWLNATGAYQPRLSQIKGGVETSNKTSSIQPPLLQPQKYQEWFQSHQYTGLAFRNKNSKDPSLNL